MHAGHVGSAIKTGLDGSFRSHPFLAVHVSKTLPELPTSSAHSGLVWQWSQACEEAPGDTGRKRG